MPLAVNLEWLNANGLRSYPVCEDGDRTDLSGAFTIPNDLIVSMQISFARSYIDGYFYIKSVLSYSDFCSIDIGYHDGANEIWIASVKVDYSQHVKNQYYQFSGSGEHHAIMGNVCISSVENIKKEGFGNFTFSVASTRIEPSCLYVSIPAVKAVEVYSGSQLVHVESDVLRLIAGENIKLSYVGSSGNTTGIRIDAISGENVKAKDECNNAIIEMLPCIKTINGVGPDDSGNIDIVGDECIKVDPKILQNQIELSDLCSSSCCGCDELEDLMTGLGKLKENEQSIMDSIQASNELYAKMLSTLTARY